MDRVSVIVPIYNERQNIDPCYREVTSVMERMGCGYEIVFVDDGSSDGSLEVLSGIAANDPNVRVIEFRRNFGQTAALAAGFQHARYEIVVAMDGDLQNDPAEIPRMVAKLEEGYDLVAGWRKDRKDKFFSRRLPSMIANWLISKSTKVQLHDYGCTLKVMRAEVAKGIRLYGEMHRFIPALADQVGARIAELPVNHRERKFGKSKYGISRTLRVILDLITVKFLLGYSKRPIHLFGTIGLLSSAAGTITLAILTYQRLFQHVPMGNRPLLALGVMLIIIGLQFLVFGLLAEVLARTYYESQDKPVYVVRRIIASAPEGTPNGEAGHDESGGKLRRMFVN
ncbi:MAG: glycosyltransferase family 2 protein [Deltaproteobacteria bacterium]|nr:glycosyltransferase family 2 protein [Deltaproteobacteria bacterium]